jgi:hypothetical protein
VGRQRHLLQAQVADQMVGRVVKKLKAIGAYDDSLVIVTADHGVAFTAGAPMRSVTKANYPEILWPPLFVKYPNETRGKVDDRPAQSVDIVPTIADVVGVKMPYPVDGRSLLDSPRPEGMRPFYQWNVAGGFGLAGATVAEPGTHLDFDGRKGFAEVLTSRAAAPATDAALRIYQHGTYGALVGREAAPLVHDVPGDESVGIVNRKNFADIDPSSHWAPWASGSGGVGNVTGTNALAIAVNGRIAAVTAEAPVTKTAKGGQFTFVVPPELVRKGQNDLSVFIIRGTAANPSLDPIRLTS